MTVNGLLQAARILWWIFSWTYFLFFWAIAEVVNATFGLNLDQWQKLKLTIWLPTMIPMVFITPLVVEQLFKGQGQEAFYSAACGMMWAVPVGLFLLLV
jgi:hypothetical protein